jgi:glutamate synthase domain-containing protein 3
VVILGQTGRNFAAGMSGGIAYVFDADGTFEDRCNPGLVDVEPLTDEDVAYVHEMVSRHVEVTDSPRGRSVLDQWTSLFDSSKPRLVRVMPRDYKRVLLAEARARAESREPEFAELIGVPSS